MRNGADSGSPYAADRALAVAAGFAMCLVLARANLQSATIDECDTYLTFSALPWPSHWYPSSGNHVLNSIAVRLFTSLFGLSHLTLRSGAIIGAALSFPLATGSA